jgi:hypothetical protein
VHGRFTIPEPSLSDSRFIPNALVGSVSLSCTRAAEADAAGSHDWVWQGMELLEFGVAVEGREGEVGVAARPAGIPEAASQAFGVG